MSYWSRELLVVQMTSCISLGSKKEPPIHWFTFEVMVSAKDNCKRALVTLLKTCPWHPLVAGFPEVPPHSRSLYDDPLLAGKLALEDVNVYMRRQSIENRMKKSFTTTRYCLTQT